ncbi:hypothetical protein LXA43DRAFT_977872 [Ganoderma leucocontextum]|nr:hypothetical protein LXA43DRAFT_977872 [Ganoderma leucocontextum]
MIIHQAWFPFIARCPNCRSRNVQPNGWTATGHREVHGLRRKECVLGVQFRCVDCAAKRAEGGGSEEADEKYCFSTTNAEFWQKMSLWEIPREYYCTRWCFTLLHSEIGEMLFGLKRCFELLNVDNPWAVVVDNCCHFRNMIINVFPEAAVLQDVWHIIMRYVICVMGGTRNPHRAGVGEDISNAIIKTKAHDGIPARYWSQEEQEERLVAAFEKWAAVGGVWSAAAEKTHREQLEHVRKGCLARPREDVATDGSRIEGTHKGWNSLQRTHPSGVEVLTALAADHVLRHNIRVDYANTNPYPFTTSTFGSHHVGLVNACGQLWNSLLDPVNRGQKRPPADLSPVPVLQPAASNESFGLVKANSDFTVYHSFIAIKEEPDDSLVNLSAEDPEEAERIVRSLGIDPTLLHKPLRQDPGLSTSESAGQTYKRARALQSDAPSSSAPFASTSSTLLTPAQATATTIGPAASTLSGPAASSSSGASTASLLPSFFSRCRLDTATPDPTASPIYLPVPIISGTTRSQILISVVTGLDARSLRFPRNDSEEFYLFMDMRARHRWVTYNMSALGWVEAASIYNAALEEKKGTCAIRKTPRALMEKLEEVEKTIHFRLKHNDFTSKSGSTTFWKNHCLAVDLSMPGKRAKGKGKLIAPAKPITRKPNTCHRCLSIMWAHGEGNSENHKKGYCSDGVKQKLAPVDGIIEELPPWPQPNDIFTKGTHFWPKRFTRTVRELYDMVTDGDRLSSPKAMEYAAFADMLRARLIVIPATATQASCVQFKLYRGLELGEQPGNPSDIVDVDGVKYLHVTYLSEASFQEVVAAA